MFAAPVVVNSARTGQWLHGPCGVRHAFASSGGIGRRAGIRFGLSGHAADHRGDGHSGPVRGRGIAFVNHGRDAGATLRLPEAKRNPLLVLRLAGLFLLR